MKVLITGPESSGTTVTSRIFEQAGAEVIHRSATYDKEYPDLRELAINWADAVVVVFRDPFATMRSQSWVASPFAKLQRGYREIFWALGHHWAAPIFVITYEQMVANQDSINPLLKWLGLDPDAVTVEVRDENGKHYEAYGIHRGGHRLEE